MIDKKWWSFKGQMWWQLSEEEKMKRVKWLGPVIVIASIVLALLLVLKFTGHQ